MRNPIMSSSKMANLCILLVLLVTMVPSHAQPQPAACKSYKFGSIKPNGFSTCVDLPELNSFLHWNYNPFNATLEIAYRHMGIPATAPPKWVVWALNPVDKGMVGAQCLVAYRKGDGSVEAYTSPITSYGTDLATGALSFDVSGLSAVSQDDEIIIFATIKVPNNSTSLNQVWQDGPLSKDGKPQAHPLSGPNARSMASLDLLTSVATSDDNDAVSSSFSMRNLHGLLCALSWGLLMPIGALIARYMRQFPSADPAWFYLHVGCQLSAYFIGIAGWAIGIKLGNESAMHFPLHRGIGIALFILGTLQMSAILIRPKKDHKYRSYWNRYHQFTGAMVIMLSVINIFLGLKILNPDKIWSLTYYWVLAALVATDIGLEVFMSCIRKRKSGEEGIRSQDQVLNGGTYYVRP